MIAAAPAALAPAQVLNFPRIVIFGGPGRSGESTLAKRFAEENGCELISGGDYMRRIAMRANCVRNGYQIPEDESKWNLDFADTDAHRKKAMEAGRDIDLEADVANITKMLRAITADPAEGKPALVVESKIMARLLHSPSINEIIKIALLGLQNPDRELLAVLKSYKKGEFGNVDLANEVTVQLESLLGNTKSVWVDAGLEVRATRSLMKIARAKTSAPSPEGGPVREPIQLEPAVIQQESTKIADRQIRDADAFNEIYGIPDYPRPGALPANDLYGTVIENSNQTPDRSYQAVCEALSIPVQPLAAN